MAKKHYPGVLSCSFKIRISKKSQYQLAKKNTSFQENLLVAFSYWVEYWVNLS